MNLKIGIVGLPNAGKSTLFNALLKKQVADVAPYPFCTIEPNVGIVPVPDARLDKLADVIAKSEGVLPPVVPAIVEFVDIAGLVKGASQGEGLGNKFLSHIREVHLICHVLRIFPDENIPHVAGIVDPVRDKSVIEMELALADLQTLDKQQPPKGTSDSKALKRFSVITKVRDLLNRGIPVKDAALPPEESELLRDLQLLTAKPVILVSNVAENQLGQMNNLLPSGLNDAVILSAKVESDLAALSSEDQSAYLAGLGLQESGLDRLIRRAYRELNLISFLTCGVKESRAWTVKDGTSARDASGVIHTDFAAKFIKADIVSLDGFVSAGGWTACRQKGLVRQEGRDYRMKDGDVVEFKIGT